MVATSAITMGSRVFRTTAYSASYSPKYATGHASHLALGIPVVGILERPHSGRPPSNLLAWDHACYRDWENYPNYSRFTPAEREALLGQDLTDWPPQLGGDNFVIRNRFHFVPGLRIDQPLVPTEVLRAVSSHRRTLDAVADHARGLDQLALPPSPAAHHAVAPAATNATYHAPNPVVK